MSIDQFIEEAKNLGKPSGPCPRCNEAAADFKQHDRRERKLRVICSGFVERREIVLKRWKCPLCGRTFTHYPEFVIPYKHYIIGTIAGLTHEYVEKPGATYREVVHPEGQAFGYFPHEDSSIDERQLSHSTVWDWLGWLGSLQATLQQGLKLLRQKEVGFGLHRFAIVIPASKYQSAERKQLLEQGALLLEVAPIFQTVFGCSIFSRTFPTLSNMTRPAPG